MSVENSGRGTRSGWDIKEWTRYFLEEYGRRKNCKISKYIYCQL